MIRKLTTYAGVALLGSALIGAFIAYFVSSVDSEAGLWFDGFGRSLAESPWFVRFVFGQDRQWAGWFWFVADLVLFWGAIALGVKLIDLGRERPHL